MTIFICVLAATLVCSEISGPAVQQIDPSVIVQSQQNNNTVDMLLLEDNTSMLCLEGGC